jgi:CRAL/TRIO domain
MFLPGQV